ncbi:MAG: efflux RND transporter periplasmic adaptor subunit [Candidatus Omnitrophota bacterium]|nr:efflux RND transporter periplasmic adaptor subunit [Candidatus Omnitrophota bacterium]
MRKNSKNIIVVITALVLIFGISFVIQGCAQKEGTVSGQDKVVYRCPMHPAYTSDRPGDCPICGMKLVKIEKSPEPAKTVTQAPEKSLEEVCIEHDCTMKDCTMYVKTMLKPGERIICPICGEVISTASGKVIQITKQPQAAAVSGTTVMISPEKQQLIGVRTELVKRLELIRAIRASGKIAYDPQLMVTQEEFIQAIKNEDNVKDSPLLDVVERAKSLTQAARRKLKLLGMSDEQIVELQNSRKADTSLYLPAKGESVWAYVAIYEYEIGLVKVGTPVEIEAVAYPGEIFKGVVVSINPVLDPATRTNQVRVKIPNPDDKLKPEMFVNAKIKENMGEKLAVPQDAVLDTGLRKIVYLSEESGVLESREVRLGPKAEGYYEVLDGLKEGDIVITSGNFLIDSESKLKAASQSAEHKHGQ